MQIVYNARKIYWILIIIYVKKIFWGIFDQNIFFHSGIDHETFWIWNMNISNERKS